MKYIDLKTFRQNNNLSQEELAKFMNITRAYICRVETGRANLSRTKVKFLLDHASDYSFVPHYNRLMILQNRLNTNKVLTLFPDVLIEQVKFGEIRITEQMADVICSNFPTVKKEWLLTGNGDMTREDYANDIKEIKTRLDNIQTTLDKFLKYVLMDNLE